MAVERQSGSEADVYAFEEVRPYLERGMNVPAGFFCSFGRYEGEDITWRVLDAKDGSALLVSEKALAPGRYHHTKEDITWDKSSLRAWLNDEFLYAAFNDGERKRIFDTTRSNEGSINFGTPGGPDTDDNVFCLSYREALRYFTSPEELICYPTRVAKGKGVWTNDEGASPWWLRTPGDGGEFAAYVDEEGRINNNGFSVRLEGIGVRPAIVVDIAPESICQFSIWDSSF